MWPGLRGRLRSFLFLDLDGLWQELQGRVKGGDGNIEAAQQASFSGSIVCKSVPDWRGTGSEMFADKGSALSGEVKKGPRGRRMLGGIRAAIAEEGSERSALAGSDQDGVSYSQMKGKQRFGVGGEYGRTGPGL